MELRGKGGIKGISRLYLSTIQSVRGPLNHPLYQGVFRPEQETNYPKQKIDIVIVGFCIKDRMSDDDVDDVV